MAKGDPSGGGAVGQKMNPMPQQGGNFDTGRAEGFNPPDSMAPSKLPDNPSFGGPGPGQYSTFNNIGGGNHMPMAQPGFLDPNKMGQAGVAALGTAGPNYNPMMPNQSIGPSMNPMQQPKFGSPQQLNPNGQPPMNQMPNMPARRFGG